MSSPSFYGNGSHTERTLDFIETTQYYSPQTPAESSDSNVLAIPPRWNRYVHPNGDVYYHNRELRLTTPDNILDPNILGYIMDARVDHLQCIEDDPNLSQLPSDWEMTVADVSDSASVIRMYSREAKAAYLWNEEQGLQLRSKEHFWSLIAEFPSHHNTLPPNAEQEFSSALIAAKTSLAQGNVFPFSERQIDQIIARYESLKAQRANGINTIPALTWLMGVVMPLDAVDRSVFDSLHLEAMMDDLRV
ncbi:hypothetical protein K443DRAFT_7597 [Laccaria amethystina LaAM-08-1]|uniref:WW domain-containing protein n=1 Tax=Laccaria amethystina LaAM-08-1 TaxID=1095629 RepID=A0A0C9WQI6_9AGAR|nr:hypothetical protein K443DRAFT_7597 [Laccaria amethystina LaAM-08-1]